MRLIVIKKSELATYKGLGLTNAEIAKRLEISPAEVSDALIHFGMKKGEVKKDYTIKYDNDIELEVPEKEEKEEEGTNEGLEVGDNQSDGFPDTN